MRVLWDLRLFSHRYGIRGVGTYARQLCRALCKLPRDFTLFVWGDSRRIAPLLADDRIHYIPYCSRGDWKVDGIIIPWLILRYRIDVLHYWVSLGPIFRMGSGFIHPCRVCATVHDLGVENWPYIPHTEAVRRSLYWRVQTHILSTFDRIFCVSGHTQQQVEKRFPRVHNRTQLLYPPLSVHAASSPDTARKKYFITLAGGPNKNTASVVRAFQHFAESYPDYSLCILGDSINDDIKTYASMPTGVNIEYDTMEHYTAHLQQCSGLLFCSLHEGLGLPPLEAMQQGCPAVVSDIPPLRETCGDCARFVNPSSLASISDGIKDCAVHTSYWSRKALEGIRHFEHISRSSPTTCLNTYRHLIQCMRIGSPSL